MPAHPDDPATGAALDPAAPADPLARERAHLAASRSALRAMREDVEALDIKDVTANWVNAEVLEAPDRRAHQGAGRPAPTPRSSSAASTTCTPRRGSAEGAEGERSTSAAGTSTTPTATRWSSTGARPSPSRSTGPPRPTRRTSALRRRFGYTGGDLTAYEDEHLSDPAEAAADQQAAPAGDRAAARRPDAGHRRDDPAGAGRDRPRPACPARSASRAAPAPGRPPSACTGSPTSSTPTASASPAPAPSSSGRTAPSSTTSSRSCPALGELEVKQATVDDLVAARRRCAARTRRRPPSSRATPGWRRCCAGPSARTSPLPTEPVDGRARLAALAGTGVRTRGDRRGSCWTATSATAPPARPCRSGSRTRCWYGWSRRARRRTTGCRTRWPATPP